MGRKKNLLKSSTLKAPLEPTPLTFMGHIRELRRRLFWTALWFVVATGAIFPFYHTIIQILMRPLGDEKLYFLSPVGGLSFAMKICMYVGLIVTLPVLIYNLYRFIAPAMPTHRARKAIGYVSLSIALAALGVTFAYVVSLPSAIYFLTHFNLGNVSAMLTVDAYLSFIVSYVLAGALLFQLPLIMLIVDNITPTPPSRWNKYQRHMIVAALVIAMLITPVPDIINQFILAAPIIIMYQLGIVMVWLRHRKLRKSKTAALAESDVVSEPLPKADTEPVPERVPTPVVALDTKELPSTPEPSIVTAVTANRPMKRSIDGVYRPTAMASRIERPVTVPARPEPIQPVIQPRPMRMGTTIDGFFPARPAT